MPQFWCKNSDFWKNFLKNEKFMPQIWCINHLFISLQKFQIMSPRKKGWSTAGELKPGYSFKEQPVPRKKTAAQLGYYSAGQLLKIQLHRAGIKPIELAQMLEIPHQRIYEYLNDKRRLTVEASVKIEKALHMRGEKGYFYRMQARHDIYLYLYENT